MRVVKLNTLVLFLGFCWLQVHGSVRGQEKLPAKLGQYQYETKPDDEAFTKFNPRKAPARSLELLLKPGDKLAICGDSITEQKMYSRIIESYLTACVPDLQISVRQLGWSGEKTDGFLRRMERDCLTFEPTIATLCYGMNDARYRPFDVNNGRWYEDFYTAIVREFKSRGVRVVLGSPGPSGKLATWVKSRSGTLDEHNVHLCALRDIAIEISEREQVAFADMFWPMYQAQVFADRKYSKSENKYDVTGEDGIHPGWAGHVMMAFAFLKSMGLDGDLGTINIDLATQQATATGHQIVKMQESTATIESKRYPFCAEGPHDQDTSIRSGMTLVSFDHELNRMLLTVTGLKSPSAKVHWGEWEKSFSREQLQVGINLAEHFERNPFSAAFQRVDEAVAVKQAYETEQIKKAFHSKEAQENFAQVVRDTEVQHQLLAEAVGRSLMPVTHVIRIEPSK